MYSLALNKCGSDPLSVKSAHFKAWLYVACNTICDKVMLSKVSLNKLKELVVDYFLKCYCNWLSCIWFYPGQWTFNQWDTLIQTGGLYSQRRLFWAACYFKLLGYNTMGVLPIGANRTDQWNINSLKQWWDDNRIKICKLTTRILSDFIYWRHSIGNSK